MSHHSIRQRRILPLLLIVLTLPMLLVYLNSWPATWFDEGAFLHGAKNIALYGEYGTLSAGEFTRFDPILAGAGPAVLVPIAGLFRIAGVGLVQARVISVLYALAAMWLFFSIANQLMDIRSALVATGLLVWSPWGDFLQFSRFAMGEMASLAFILTSIFLWWRSLDRSSLWWSAGSGLALGLALLSKPQNVVALAALVIVGIADVFYFRRLGLKRWIIPLLIAMSLYLAWQGVQVVVLGSTEYARRLQTGEMASRALATLFKPSRVLANFNNLAKSGYLLWTVPALLYVCFDVIRKKRDAVREFHLLALVCVWLLWFMLGSIGWIRYAFVPISLSSLFLADLFGDLTDGFRLNRSQIQQALQQGNDSLSLARLAMALVPVLMIGYGAIVNMDHLLNERNQSAQAMATYLTTQVEQNSLIETWEWEIDLLSQNSFHHPSTDVLEAMVRRDQLGIPPLSDPYSPGSLSPSYVLDGPMSKNTSLYVEYVQQECALTKSIGPYDLYKCGS